MAAIISRFAPAPTGYLHLGHIVNAVYVWRETRARNGRILLRFEDHDRQRSRPEFEAAILDDLAWLGFAPDEPPVRPSEQCGDLLLRDRDGNWTYQFAATVDDYVQGVTLVIRGDDLLASTGRQLQLARLLGRAQPPEFLHHPLIMKSPTQKLSKSDRDTGIRDLRAAGWTPAQVIERALSMVSR